MVQTKKILTLHIQVFPQSQGYIEKVLTIM
jgi:hypothetical protein